MRSFERLSYGLMRRSLRITCGALLLISWGLCAAVAAPLKPGEQLRLPTMEPVGDVGFDLNQFKRRWLLLFASSRDSADQSRRWGRVIKEHYGARVAGWNKDRGQRVLVVPVLDTSAGLLDDLPLWAIKFMVKELSGDDDGPDERVGVLIDRTGQVRSQIDPPSSSDAVLILLGPDGKLAARVIGDYSPASAAKLFAALDSALADGQ